jgi:hypothetical protein
MKLGGALDPLGMIAGDRKRREQQGDQDRDDPDDDHQLDEAEPAVT